MSGKVSDDAPWVEVRIPKPEGRIDIGGRLMVVISAEEWERVVDTLQDYADAIKVQEMMDDPTEKSIPWEEVRKELFANNIKKVRKRKKITQKELAKRLRVSQARVSQIEPSQPGIGALMLLAPRVRPGAVRPPPRARVAH